LHHGLLACLDFERAVSEYGKLAAYPSERLSVMAQLGAARDAAASAVPHLDLVPDINSGIREAQNVLAQAKAFSAGASDAV
jgi:hypothetical protein